MSAVVLFARRTSVYFRLCDEVFDEARDARTYAGARPVVAHPPCRGWGKLRAMARVAPGELDLALFAVATVRRVGGVLEHPAYSRLWGAAQLPRPGERDACGGWTLGIEQKDFGHRAHKATWLYVVGVEPGDVPAVPLNLRRAVTTVERMGRPEREATPEALARWLLELAGKAKVS